MDWDGLYNVGTADTAALKWVFTSSCTQTSGSTAKASGSCSLAMPSTAGTYEFRLFANNAYTKLATSQQVTVGASGTPSPTTAVLVASASHVSAGGSLAFNWSNVSSAAAKDWVGVYKVGQSDATAIAWIF